MSLIKITLLFFSMSTMAIASSSPADCNPIKITGEVLTLGVKKPTVILLQNISEGTLWLTHPVKDPGASAGWTSQIQGGKWSAMVLTEKKFILHCTESRPGHEQQIACEGAITACIWKKAKIPNEEKGTFWATEDKSLSDLKAALLARGFTLATKAN
jgi:hypothetical protein